MLFWSTKAQNGDNDMVHAIKHLALYSTKGQDFMWGHADQITLILSRTLSVIRFVPLLLCWFSIWLAMLRCLNTSSNTLYLDYKITYSNIKHSINMRRTIYHLGCPVDNIPQRIVQGRIVLTESYDDMATIWRRNQQIPFLERIRSLLLKWLLGIQALDRLNLKARESARPKARSFQQPMYLDSRLMPCFWDAS
jgi:hypothetical protein